MHEYVVANKAGDSLEYFRSRRGAIKMINARERKRPGSTAGWTVLAYDRRGNRIGEPESADALLGGISSAPALDVSRVSAGERSLLPGRREVATAAVAISLIVPQVAVVSSEKLAASGRASGHRLGDAKDTPDLLGEA